MLRFNLKLKLWGSGLREDAPSISLYILPPPGVTHSHLPALLTKGRGEMAMDNSLRAVVKNNLRVLMTVIIAKSGKKRRSE